MPPSWARRTPSNAHGQGTIRVELVAAPRRSTSPMARLADADEPRSSQLMISSLASGAKPRRSARLAIWSPSGPGHHGRHRGEDGLDVPAGLQAEHCAAVVEQVE